MPPRMTENIANCGVTRTESPDVGTIGLHRAFRVASISREAAADQEKCSLH